MVENMSALYFYAVGGSVIWGVVNVLKKKFLTEGIHEDVVTVLFSAGCGVSALTLEFALNGFVNVGFRMWTAAFFLPLAFTAVLNVLIQYWNVLAIKYEDVSIVTPLASTMPMFVIVISYVLLGEFPTFWGRIGIMSIAFGAYVLYLKGTEYPLPGWLGRLIPVRHHERAAFWLMPWLRLISSRGARYALGIAYIGAVTVNFDKLAVLAATPMLFTGLAFIFVALVIWLKSNYAGDWKSPGKAVLWKVFGMGLFMGIGAVMMNAGYLYGIVPYVGTLKRAQILWTIVFAWIFLKEKH